MQNPSFHGERLPSAVLAKVRNISEYPATLSESQTHRLYTRSAPQPTLASFVHTIYVMTNQVAP
jgi:hypothetical protein